MSKLKVMTIFGTRPEAIKMAPIIKEMKRYPDLITPLVTVTAQHRSMLDQVLDLFVIKPDFDLNIMAPNQTLFDITEKALRGLQGVYIQERPDFILVHGDTTTTFVASLASFYLQIPVGHVEAGLRTYDKYSPFPEEMNRCLTDVISDLYFAPTQTAKDHLLAEGVKEKNIYITGNTVIDALKQSVHQDYKFSDSLLNDINYNKNRVLLVTTHRRENLGEPLRNVYKALRKIVKEYKDVIIIFPVHKNPKVQSIVEEELGGLEQVVLTEPMDYEPFINLMNKSFLILTDSGGLQEEAPSLGKPVLVLRNTTERPEAVNAGTVKLVGTDESEIYCNCKVLLDDKNAYNQMANAVNPYGDGRAAIRTVQALLFYNQRISIPPEEYKV